GSRARRSRPARRRRRRPPPPPRRPRRPRARSSPRGLCCGTTPRCGAAGAPTRWCRSR
ncbi:unnamed protein product, partial [Prorocentrum cordatum]